MPANASAILGRCAILAIRERLGSAFAALILLSLFGLGIDMIIHPRRHPRQPIRKEGEMLRDWNETEAQFCGLIFSCGSAWILYGLVQSAWVECFKS